MALRPLAESDYPTMFAWRVDLDSLYLWSNVRRLPTFDEYEEELEQVLRNSTLLLVTERPSGNPVGFVQAYSTNLTDGFTFMLMYAGPAYRGRGPVLEAAVLFFDYLFSYLPLRKIYAEIYEFNEPMLSQMARVGFVEEGRFRQHSFYRDRYWDLLRFALYRDKWVEVRDRWARILNISAEVSELYSLVEQREAPRKAGAV